MEQGVSADAIGLVLEGEAALSLDCFECGEALEAAIGEWLIRQWPQMLGWLQLRRIRRQDHQVDALWHLHLLPGMPASSIEDQEDPPLRPGAYIPGKSSEHLAEEVSGDRRQEPPLGLPRRGTDEATDVEPLVALLHRSDGALPDGSPHLPDQRQEPDAVLIRRPELNRCIGVCRPDLVYLVGELS